MRCSIDDCEWRIVTNDEHEALLARVRHLRDEHFDDPDQEYDGDNLTLIRFVHDALHAIDDSELDGWYSSQLERMRGDACEIMGVHDPGHERTAVSVDHTEES